jgi:hypothetical protein
MFVKQRLRVYISSHVVEYITGYVASKILDSITCIICKQRTEGNVSDMPLLSKLKNRGGYQAPSSKVKRICHMSERFIRQHQNQLLDKSIKSKLIVKIFSSRDL